MLEQQLKLLPDVFQHCWVDTTEEWKDREKKLHFPNVGESVFSFCHHSCSLSHTFLPLSNLFSVSAHHSLCLAPLPFSRSLHNYMNIELNNSLEVLQLRLYLKIVTFSQWIFKRLVDSDNDFQNIT